MPGRKLVEEKYGQTYSVDSTHEPTRTLHMNLEIQNARDGVSSRNSNSIWLDALTDNMANVNADSANLCTVDPVADGEHYLVAAVKPKQLKVWRSCELHSEDVLPQDPTATTTLCTECRYPENATALLAVAAGPHVFLYKKLKPHFKFTISPAPISAGEVCVWKSLEAGSVTLREGLSSLQDLRASGESLSARSSKLLSMKEASAQEIFVQSNPGPPAMNHTVITCMEVLRKRDDDAQSASILLLGTEDCHILALDDTCTSEKIRIQVDEAPVFMATHGALEMESRIFVAARDGKVYFIKNLGNAQIFVELETHAVGMVCMARSLVVGCMNNSVHAFNLKGQKQYSIYLPSHILALTSMETCGKRMVKCIVVGLANSEIQVYREKNLISTHRINGTISGLYFGRYGREDNTLVTTTTKGTLDIKIMARAANLEASVADPLAGQESMLQIPKKTKLHVELAQREVEQPAEMHRIYQKDMCKLRLETARAYHKVLTDGKGALSMSSRMSLQLNATVEGMGPYFRISVEILNTDKAPIRDLVLLAEFDGAQYVAERRLVNVPRLFPFLPCVCTLPIECIDSMGSSGEVQLLVVHKASVVPLLQALVKLPMFEPEVE